VFISKIQKFDSERVFFVVIGDCVKRIVNAHDRDEVDFSIS